MGMMLANPERIVAEALAATLAPPPPLDLNKWAEDNVVFGRESDRQGPYNSAAYPWNRRILEVLQPDHPAREVALRGSAQFGKTVLALVFTVGTVSVEGGYLLYTHPQEDNAKRWAKTKLRPMLRQATALRRIFGEVDDNSLFYIERRDGQGAIQISGARSESSLSMISVSAQVQDDLAKWEDNNAGDPEMQANSRSDSFPFAKIFKCSTPMVAPGCRITRAFLKGSQEHWHVPCPHCGHMQPLAWDNFLDNLDEANPDAACFSCTGCGVLIENHHVMAIRLKGSWVAHNPAAPPDCVSFHFWRVYTGVFTLAQIARKWLEVKGDPESERVFFNDWLGLPYEVAGTAPAWEGLRDRAEESGRRRGIIPAGYPLLTVGVDVQGGETDPRLECQIVAWGPELRRAVVDYVVVPGWIGDEKVRAAMTAFLTRKWRNEAGNEIEADMLAIDANAYTDEVEDWVRLHPRNRVIAVRGSNRDTAPPIEPVAYERNKKGKKKRLQGRWYNVGVSGMRAAFYRNLAKSDPQERGYIDLPRGMGDQFYKQATALRRVRVNAKGKRGVTDGIDRYSWELPSGERKEALDTGLYAEAAAIRQGWRERQMDEVFWEGLIAEREKPRPGSAQLDFEDLTRGQPDPAPQAANHPPRGDRSDRLA